MMYKAFTTEDRLWQKLVERFRVPDNVPIVDKQKIQMRVCVFIKNWIEKAGADLHEKLRSTIRQFLDTEMAENGLDTFAGAIKDRLDNPRTHEERVINEIPPKPDLPMNIKDTTLSLVDFTEQEVARQLTLISFDIYKKIHVTEFFRAAWSKEKLKHLAPHILQMIDHYNAVSSGFATAIVTVKDARQRVKMVQRVIEIGIVSI